MDNPVVTDYTEQLEFSTLPAFPTNHKEMHFESTTRLP